MKSMFQNHTVFNKVFDDFEIKNNIIIGKKIEIPDDGKHIGQKIYEIFNKFPEYVGQIDSTTGENMTFAEMQDQAVRFALWLQTQGIGKGDVVAFSTDNHKQSFLPMVSTLYVGGIFNPWPPELSLIGARQMLNLTNPTVFITNVNNVSLVLEAMKLENADLKLLVFGHHPTISSIDDVLVKASAEEVSKFRVDEIKDHNIPAKIIFTSGSTGAPKGVVHSYRTVYGNTMMIETTIDNTQLKEPVIMWNSLPYWITGTLFTLKTILFKQTRIILNHSNLESICQIIEKYKVAWLFLLPTNYVRLKQSDLLKIYKLESLKYLITGGSKIYKKVTLGLKQALPHTYIQPCYGLSEAGTIVSIHNEKTKNLESVGFLMPNFDLKIVEISNRQALPPNEQGEILIRAPFRMLEYFKNQTETRDTVDDKGWIYSGDKGYYDENGEIFITDRMKEMIRFQGFTVAPSELENVLMSHPDVMMAVVVPVPNIVDVERPLAFIKKVSGSNVTSEELIKLSENLGDHKKLSGGVEFLEDFPISLNGKIDRKKLKETAKGYGEK